MQETQEERVGRNEWLDLVNSYVPEPLPEDLREDGRWDAAWERECEEIYAREHVERAGALGDEEVQDR